MSLDRFEIISTIYNTLQDSLKLVRNKEDGKLYTIKSVFISENDEKAKDLFFNELRILVPLAHKNIISYKEAFFDKKTKSLNMVIEYIDGGDLSMKINLAKQKNLYFKEKTIWKIFLQILEGINYLHNKYIIHRDLKTSSIYLSKKGEVKIGGLNVGKNIEDNGMALTQIGTPYFTAPEIWKQMPYDYKCDIWSLGCILYEMVTLCVPFLGLNIKELYHNILNLQYKPIPKFYSKDLFEIINLMLNKNPENRPSATQLLNNKIILKKFDEYNIKNDSKDASSYINNAIQKIIDDYNKKLTKFDKSQIFFKKTGKLFYPEEKINKNKRIINSKFNNILKKNNNTHNKTNSEYNKIIDNNKNEKNFGQLKIINIRKHINDNLKKKKNNLISLYPDLNNNYCNSTFSQKLHSSVLNNTIGKSLDKDKKINIFSIDKNDINKNNINYKKINLNSYPIRNQKSSSYISNFNNEVKFNPIKEINLTKLVRNNNTCRNKIFKEKQNIPKKIIFNNNNNHRDKIYLNSSQNFNEKTNYSYRRYGLDIKKKNSPLKNKSNFDKIILNNSSNISNFVNRSLNLNDNHINQNKVNSVLKYKNKAYLKKIQTFNVIHSKFLGNNYGINKNNEITKTELNERKKLYSNNNRLKQKMDNLYFKIKNLEIDNINYKSKLFKRNMIKKNINSFTEYNQKMEMNNEVLNHLQSDIYNNYLFNKEL